MQKFIFKYGLAVHLAILAVAPLFLFLFFAPPVGGVVLLWLSLSAASWIVMGPSLRSGEYLHDARARVVSGVVRDPLFWSLLAFAAFAGVCAVNGGVSLVYDAEAVQWQISKAFFPILPCAVGDAGFPLFSAVVALVVLVVGVRHALGRSARMAFLSVASSLSGMTAMLLFAAVRGGWPAAAALSLAESGGSFVGLVFGFHLIGGTAALVSVIENRWRFLLLLSVFSVGGSAVGLFCFSPVYAILAVLLAEVLVLLYAFVFVCRVFQATLQLKLLAAVGMSITLAALVIAGMWPPSLLQPKVDAIVGLAPFAEDFWEKRAVLSAVAFKTWIANLWIGGGLASFPLDFRFFAQPSDWLLLPRGASGVPNGWWLLLAERGLLGIVVLALPILLLTVHYVRRLVLWFRVLDLPHPACWVAPLVLALGIALGFFDCSFLRPDALMAALPIVAVSAAAFSAAGRRDHV